jgi:hypothetical protein
MSEAIVPLAVSFAIICFAVALFVIPQLPSVKRRQRLRLKEKLAAAKSNIGLCYDELRKPFGYGQGASQARLCLEEAEKALLEAQAEFTNDDLIACGNKIWLTNHCVKQAVSCMHTSTLLPKLARLEGRRYKRMQRLWTELHQNTMTYRKLLHKANFLFDSRTVDVFLNQARTSLSVAEKEFFRGYLLNTNDWLKRAKRSLKQAKKCLDIIQQQEREDSGEEKSNNQTGISNREAATAV